MNWPINSNYFISDPEKALLSVTISEQLTKAQKLRKNGVEARILIAVNLRMFLFKILQIQGLAAPLHLRTAILKF